MFQGSGVTCHLSPVTFSMSLTLTDTATDPPLPHYPQQDAAADLDLDPSAVSGKDPPFFSSSFCAASVDPF